MLSRRYTWPVPGRAILICMLVIASYGLATARTRAQTNPAQDQAQGENSAPATPLRKPDAKKAKQSYQDGLKDEQAGDWETAYGAYTEAVEWAPDNRDYVVHRDVAKSRVIQLKVDQAERSAVLNHMADARKYLLEARYLDPTNAVVRERLTELSAAQFGDPEPTQSEFEPAGEVQLDYALEKHNINYRGDTQGLYNAVAALYGVEVAFDVDVVSRPARLQLTDIDFPTALRIIGDMTGTFWRPLTSHLFFVTPDTPQKRRDYATSVVRTIVLPASETPDEMTETLRVVREIAGITRSDLDTRTRTLTMRASPQAVAVATGLVHDLQKPQGELILEIEMLEVDRTYARELGIAPPETSKIYSLSPQQIQEAQQSLTGLVSVITQVFGTPSSLAGLTSTQITSLLGSGQLGVGSLLPPLVAFGGGETTLLATLPGATANFQNMLSLVQQGRRILLRAEDGQPATFFVGERFPVSLATYASSFNGSATNINGVSTSDFPTTNYPTGVGPTFVATASLRNNSSDDLIVTNFTDNTISVLLNNTASEGTFADQVVYPTGIGPSAIATGVFNTTNNSQIVDLAIANETANTVSILLGNGDGTFQPKTDIAVGTGPVFIASGRLHDTSANNNVDLIVANHGDNTLTILTGNGNGTFGNTGTLALPPGFGPSAIAVADFNGDGHLDLAVTDEGNATLSVFLGNGDGTFRTRTDYPVGNAPVWVATGDFNGDGVTDLAVANKDDNTVSILLGNEQASNTTLGNGTFAAQIAYPAGQGPTSIAVADYNIDGRPDLAVADEADNAVSVLLGVGSGQFGPNFEIPAATSPVAITTADFNGDGKPDVAVANNGSNNVSVILDSANFSGSTNGSTAAGTAFPGIQYLDIGIKVKATPRIHPDNEVTLQLDMESSSLSTSNFNAIPVINSEDVTQTVRVKENETAALAGIMQSNLSNAIGGTPGIAGIPGLGLIASTQNNQDADQELLILVTPRLVRQAPRKDHTMYAGQGSLDNVAGGGGPALVEPLPPPTAQPPAQTPVRSGIEPEPINPQPGAPAVAPFTTAPPQTQPQPAPQPGAEQNQPQPPENAAPPAGDASQPPQQQQPPPPREQ